MTVGEEAQMTAGERKPKRCLDRHPSGSPAHTLLPRAGPAWRPGNFMSAYPTFGAPCFWKSPYGDGLRRPRGIRGHAAGGDPKPPAQEVGPPVGHIRNSRFWGVPGGMAADPSGVPRGGRHMATSKNRELGRGHEIPWPPRGLGSRK